jgi:hypothetical protein
LRRRKSGSPQMNCAIACGNCRRGWSRVSWSRGCSGSTPLGSAACGPICSTGPRRSAMSWPWQGCRARWRWAGRALPSMRWPARCAVWRCRPIRRVNASGWGWCG